MKIVQQRSWRKFSNLTRTTILLSCAWASSQLCFAQLRPCVDDFAPCPPDQVQGDPSSSPARSNAQQIAVQNLDRQGSGQQNLDRQPVDNGNQQNMYQPDQQNLEILRRLAADPS